MKRTAASVVAIGWCIVGCRPQAPVELPEVPTVPQVQAPGPAEPALPRGSADDAELALQVRRALERGPGVREEASTIEVSVVQGRVRLTGFVLDQTVRQRAEAAAGHVAGTDRVDNLLLLQGW